MLKPLPFFAVAATLWLAAVSAALADIKDYEFQLVQNEIKSGEAIVAVRVVHKPTGKPVPEAVIFSKRLDMAPDNMATMTTPLEPVDTSEPGIYRFKTKLTMEGRWQLSVAAKLQGESGTLQGRLIIKAVP
ncbi:MAG: FixH family protein [Bradyrhizobiaceae bacterium]|nr:FixH family protein [Bradyrhizobiaceae bacterium]